MLLIKMSAPLVANINLPLNQWDKKSIRPGPVGSVGDVLTSVRIKQSMPDMPFAYDKKFGPSTDILRGSNVQDGQWFSFSDHGYNAQVKRRKLNKASSFKVDVGWIHQDIVPVERNTEPMLLDQPQQGFKTQVASILQKQGEMFKSLPGGYGPRPGDILRGNQYPVTQSGYTSQPVAATEPIPVTSQLMKSVVEPVVETTSYKQSPYAVKEKLPSLITSSRSSTSSEPFIF